MHLRSLEAAPVFADFRKPSQLSADVGDEAPRLCLCGTTRTCLEIAFGVAGAVLVGAHARQMTHRNLLSPAGAIFRRCLSKKNSYLFWQAQYLGEVHLHSAWQPQCLRRVV